MKMKTISLSSKLLMGFITVITVSTVGSVITMTNTSKMGEDIKVLIDNSFLLDRMQEMQSAMTGTLLSVERWKDPLISAKDYEDQFASITRLRDVNISNLRKYEERLNSPGYGNSPEEVVLFEAVQKYLLQYRESVAKIIERAKEVQGKANAAAAISRFFDESGVIENRDRTFEDLGTLKALYEKEIDIATEQAISVSEALTGLALAVTLVVSVLGISIGIGLSRSISSVTQSIAKALLANSEYVSSSSKELAAGSQSLAAGSSEQAASVEQISASLEEISSMVKRNADNASQANELTEAAGAAVDATNRSMQRSLAASEAIAQASNETFKIIKTIDEIAFQTNLLSLNAAVEAARAGEAGAGFAVVADEVRGLSMRSAEASKRTAELIEQTIEKVREGIDIFTATGKSIEDVVSQTHRVQQLVAQIASASDEQSKGIEQINRGVAEMEKVIQMNAASSEESAASTQELHAQAIEMTDNVYRLEGYIFGDRHIEDTRVDELDERGARDTVLRLPPAGRKAYACESGVC